MLRGVAILACRRTIGGTCWIAHDAVVLARSVTSRCDASRWLPDGVGHHRRAGRGWSSSRMRVRGCRHESQIDLLIRHMRSCTMPQPMGGRFFQQVSAYARGRVALAQSRRRAFCQHCFDDRVQAARVGWRGTAEHRTVASAHRCARVCGRHLRPRMPPVAVLIAQAASLR